nr:RuBisCO long chain, Form III-b [uncultured archaeon]
MKAKYNDILETELIEKNPTIFLARYDYNLTRDALKLLRERYQGTAVIIPELDFKAKQGDIKGCNFFYKTALSNIIRELSNEDIIPMTQFISELFLSKGKLEDVNNTYEDSGFTNYPQRAINPKSWQHLRDQVKSYFLNIDLEVPFVVEGLMDVVKDDENLTSQPFNNFYKRIPLTLQALKKAEKETGEKKVYLANCTAPADEMIKRIKFVEKCGGNYIMLDILTLGWSALQLARKTTKLPIHAHRAGHAMFDRSRDHGMKMEVIAQFARMIGVDTLHIGTAYGKMTGGKDEVLHIEDEIEHEATKQTKENLHQKWFHIKPVFAVASGGVYPGIVPKIIEFMGQDVVIQAGGGIHGHPNGTVAGAKAMRQAVNATKNKVSLKEYAKYHPELRLALEKWGD